MVGQLGGSSACRALRGLRIVVAASAFPVVFHNFDGNRSDLRMRWLAMKVIRWEKVILLGICFWQDQISLYQEKL